MKIKEVQAGIKITKNYNSYQVSLTAELETGENPEIIGKELMEKASNILKKKTGIDLEDTPLPSLIDKKKEIEVGAAWLDKNIKTQLNIKYSTGQWKEVNINDLEKTETGYQHKTKEGIFIFKKLSEKERKNDRMPLFRIYKVE
jgi:hypothetical protein